MTSPKSEADFKTELCDALRRMGAWVHRTQTGGSGRAGTPDLLVCYRGRFFGLEVKKDDKGRVTPWQDRELEAIRRAGGTAMVIRPGNVDAFMEVLVRAVGVTQWWTS